MTLDERVEALQLSVEAQRQRNAAQEQRIKELEARQRTQVTPGTALLLMVVLALTALCGSRAYAVASTLSHSEFTVTAPPGSNSAPWTLPVSESPVRISTSSVSGSVRGTSCVTITHHPSLSPSLVLDTLSWVGINAYNSASSLAVAGVAEFDDRKIVDVAGNSYAELRTNRNGETLNQVLVHNNANFALDFAIEMTW